MELALFHQPDRGSSRPEPGAGPAAVLLSMHDQRWIVAGVAVSQDVRMWVKGAQEHRHEGCEADVMHQQAVDVLQGGSRREAARRQRAQQGLNAGHVQAGRDAMTGHIGYRQAQRAIQEVEEIEIVAAHNLGRTAEGRSLRVRGVRGLLRQQRELHRLSHFQLILKRLASRHP